MDFSSGNVLGQSFGFLQRVCDDGVSRGGRDVFSEPRPPTELGELGSVLDAGLACITQVMKISDTEDLQSLRVVVADKAAVLCSVRNAVQIGQIKFTGLSPQYFFNRPVIRRATASYANRIKCRRVVASGNEFDRRREHDFVAEPPQRLHVAKNGDRTRVTIGSGHTIINYQRAQMR